MNRIVSHVNLGCEMNAELENIRLRNPLPSDCSLVLGGQGGHLMTNETVSVNPGRSARQSQTPEPKQNTFCQGSGLRSNMLGCVSLFS